MSLRLTCAACQAVIRVNPSAAGRRGQCPRCRAPLEIPTGLTESLPAPNPTPPAPPAPADTAADLMRDILAGFVGEFPPVRRTLGYRLGILLVAAAMLLLPLLYLALIAGVAALLVWHVTEHTSVLKQFGSVWFVVFLYVGPLVAGVILLFFMVKPLFARPGRRHKLRVLRLGDEPVLFAFVTRIARAVGAPEPKRIEVDCEVNASASFGEGLRGLFGRQLTLTIGLPLAAGLSARQLAGVLAHELGHFSQGAGMRLTYLVRSINAWFERVVYERDGWDETLAEWCQESGWLALTFYFASVCVWVTRGILWVFMWAGHGLCCFQMRQMEYDADRYEARLAGSQASVATLRQIVFLSVASQVAEQAVLEAVGTGSPPPDDLPGLTAALVEQLPVKERRKLDKRLAEQKTRLFDTHPAHRDRLENARQEKADGIFRLKRPAADVFRDFPKLSRAVTRDLYRRVFGKRVV